MLTAEQLPGLFNNMRIEEQLSLNLILLLKNHYSGNHKLTSLTVHIATYHFFHPLHQGVDFPQEQQILSVEALLQAHGSVVAHILACWSS